MNDIINEDVIEKVVIKSVAIYKAMSELSPPPFEDKFVNKENICQQNEIIQSQNLEKCLNETDPSKENEITDTTNETKNDYEKKSWKDITDPKERRKAYQKDYNKKRDKEKHKIAKKAYREANKQTLIDKQKAYNKLNKDKIKVYKNNYYRDNKDKLRLKQKDYINNRFKTNLQFKLRHNLRGRLKLAIKNNFKAGSAINDLGCSIEELKQYLESKFSPGMNWDNWKYDGWHIDHIKPLASFDLTDRQQFLEACHYTNLQPLWAKDNIIKSDKLL